MSDFWFVNIFHFVERHMCRRSRAKSPDLLSVRGVAAEKSILMLASRLRPRLATTDRTDQHGDAGEC